MMAAYCIGKKHPAFMVGHTKKAPQKVTPSLCQMAEWTGLEPATPGVTGRYSNQLNYHSISMVGAEGIEPPTFAL